MAEVTADVLKSKFGFNDPNVIAGILSDPNQVARYSREMGGSSSGSGGGAGTAAYDALMSRVPSSQEYAKTLNAPINESLSNYALYLRSQPQPIDVYKQFEEEAGLPEQKKVAADLRGQVYDLEDTIDRVKGTVEGTSRESLLTQAQKDQLITAKKAPLIENLTKLTTNLGRIEASIATSSQDILTKTSLVQQGVDRETQLFQTQLDVLTANAARLQSGFDSDKQTLLEVSLAKIKRGEQLNDQETDRAFQALMAETDFSNTLVAMREQAKIDLENYEAKKGVDLKYKSSGESGDSADSILSALFPNGVPTADTNQNKTTVSSPPMSAPAGTIQEYPQGSGIYWTSTGGGWQ